MSRYVVRGFQVFADLFVLSAAYWLAFLLRFEFEPNFNYIKLFFFTWPYVIVFQYLMLVALGIPNLSWRYVGTKDAIKIFWVLSIATGTLLATRIGLIGVGGYSRFVIIPIGILAMDFVLAFTGLIGIRYIRRIHGERREISDSQIVTKRTILIGAGRAGVFVAREAARNPHLGMEIVGFVDDDPMKVGTIIQGHKVYSDTDSLPKLSEMLDFEQAVITITAVSGIAIRRIMDTCESISVPAKIVPGIQDILTGRTSLSAIREVTIEDLLGRKAIELDLDAIGDFLTGKRVLITGAGGSIGSELCRQISKFKPSKLILIEQAENALFNIHRELIMMDLETDIIPKIADVCDYARIDQIFSEYQPHCVFHAAAHKHVPMMEWNPGEAIKNNVFGTRQVANAADRYGVGKFVSISTDKAVNPTSIMGATKRIAEMYIQGLSQRSKTQFIAVRFGNVLGSAGSVIPIFKEQLRSGKSLTVTHPEMKRYFMTIPEACQLVMEAATMGVGREIFVLDMGKPVKIVDLAKDLIRLSGFSEDEVRIEYSGIRPGEKLFEELSMGSEQMTKTRHKKIFIGKIKEYPFEEVEEGLKLLASVKEHASRTEIRAVLKRVVPEMYVEGHDVQHTEIPIEGATIH